MALELSLKVDSEPFKKSVDEARDRFDQAFVVAKNMIASMMLSAVTADIQGSGRFGQKYTDGLTVTVDGDSIVTKLDAPGASIFETGGQIFGDPLLWLPISGTDAEGVRARDYGDKLFSVNRKAGGPPLLFSVRDKSPKYFGVPSITEPKLFHIAETRDRVMSNFKEVFEIALGAVNG